VSSIRLSANAPRHIDIAPAAGPSGPTFKELLTALNPWWWLEKATLDTPPGAVRWDDSASPTQIGPGGGQWGGASMPPKLHHGIFSGMDYSPIPMSGTDYVLSVPGATSDGRTATQLGVPNGAPPPNPVPPPTPYTNTTHGTTQWAFPDNAPLWAGGSTSILHWFRYLGQIQNVPAVNYAGGVWNINAQFGSTGAYTEYNGASQFGLFTHDSGGVLLPVDLSVGLCATICDGSWHLIGHNLRYISSTVLDWDVYLDGVFAVTKVFTATGGNFLTTSVQATAFEVGSGGDFDISIGGGFQIQDLAILPDNGFQSSLVTPTQYTQLWNAR
jgi:hypothetical protein